MTAPTQSVSNTSPHSNLVAHTTIWTTSHQGGMGLRKTDYYLASTTVFVIKEHQLLARIYPIMSCYPHRQLRTRELTPVPRTSARTSGGVKKKK